MLAPRAGRTGQPGGRPATALFALRMQMGGTVFDLEEAELCYAPQYGSAKDVVNIAGKPCHV